MAKEKVKFKDWSKRRKIIFFISLGLLSLLTLVIITVGSYVIYVMATFYRIEDNLDISKDIHNKSEERVQLDEEYSISTYNIGFGAYTKEYSFFLDEGEMLNGTKTVGKYGKAVSKEIASKNTYGAASDVKDLNLDFLIFQEMDIDSDRCHHINQYEIFQKELGDEYSSVFCTNFHSAFLILPFNDPTGKTSNSGLSTFSKFKMESAMRRSYPVDDTFPNRYFDLDRCFSVTRYALDNGKEFVLCCSHMSAFDEGGLVRNKQMKMLQEFAKVEKDKGNYVIIGGDFNHNLCPDAPTFPSQQKCPGWVGNFDAKDFVGYTVEADPNYPTCRSTDIPYEEGVNYIVTIDGFLVSDNIEVTEVKNVHSDFIYSDHNPATMKFILH